MVDSNVPNGSDYSSNDIRSMAFQIPYSEREGSYESLGEFNLEEVENDSLEYLFENVLADDAAVSVQEELEAQYGPDQKYRDSSEMWKKYKFSGEVYLFMIPARIVEVTRIVAERTTKSPLKSV